MMRRNRDRWTIAMYDVRMAYDNLGEVDHSSRDEHGKSKSPQSTRPTV